MAGAKHRQTLHTRPTEMRRTSRNQSPLTKLGARRGASQSGARHRWRWRRVKVRTDACGCTG
eukprot:4875070-Pleurochrysis_carterae.AAC.1